MNTLYHFGSGKGIVPQTHVIVNSSTVTCFKVVERISFMFGTFFLITDNKKEKEKKEKEAA